MMRMSTKGHHATRIIVFLASSPARPISKTEIGQAEVISPGYVQQLMTTLVDAGLVRSHRGKAGGFSLTRPAEQITVQQILDATEGPFELAPCIEGQDCARSNTCPAHLLWLQATTMVNRLFEGTTVADLLRTQQSLQQQQA
jgi:Rrf2 family protein